MSIEVYPNPSNAAFTLEMRRYSDDKLSIIVTDMLGNGVYQAEGPTRERYRFGDNFSAGIYLVQVLQGNNKQSMKLLKGH